MESNTRVIVNPVTGTVIPLIDVRDEIFSNKMMGDGFAVEPKDSLVVAPVNGVIVNVFPKQHAIGIVTEDNIEMLIHTGINTAAIRSKDAYHVLKKEGDHITQGEPLAEMNLEVIASLNKDRTVITTFMDTSQIKNLKINTFGELEAGQELGTYEVNV